MRLKLIANPVAGKCALPTILNARDLLQARGADVDLHLTRGSGDAEAVARLAKDGGYDRIIAAGGDGTLNEVINGLTPSSVPLAFLPLGTTNVFALEAGIPFDVEKACRIATEGTPRPVCLGQAGQRHFLLMAGLGFDAETVYRVNPTLKKRLGKGAYILTALNLFCRMPRQAMDVTLGDGSRHTAYGVIINNAHLYGGRFSLAPQASLHSEGLYVSLLLRPGRWNFLRYALAAVTRKHGTPPLALLRKTDHIRVEGQAPIQIDGDHLGFLPMTFTASFGDLNIVFPSE